MHCMEEIGRAVQVHADLKACLPRGTIWVIQVSLNSILLACALALLLTDVQRDVPTCSPLYHAMVLGPTVPIYYTVSVNHLM